MDLSKKIFSFLFLLFCVYLHSQSYEKDIYQRLVNKYSKIETFSSKFIQINYWKEIEDTLISSGEIFYNNQKLLFIYHKPKEQLMLIDTLNLIVWDKVENQAIITKNETDISKPIDIIRKYWNQSNKRIKKNKKTIKILLIDDDITITAVLKNFIIIKLKIENSDGNIVEYNFSEIKINPKLSDKIFKIKFPDNVKILTN